MRFGGNVPEEGLRSRIEGTDRQIIRKDGLMSKTAANLTAKGLADAAMTVLLLLFTVFQTAWDAAHGRIGMGMAARAAVHRSAGR